MKSKQQRLHTQPAELEQHSSFYHDAHNHDLDLTQTMKVHKVNKENVTFEFTEVFVWGDDTQGQLGLYHQKLKKGTQDQKCFKLPKTCSFNIVIKQISCGESHSAILTNSGHLYMMGSNQYGQLGIGDNCPDFQGQDCAGSPCLVDTLRDMKVKQVECGRNFTFAITSTDNQDFNMVYAWGSNKHCQLGLQNFDSAEVPHRVQYFAQLGINITKVSAGSEHTLFLSDTGQVYGCGANSQGQLGLENDMSMKVYQPTLLEGFEDMGIEQISSGQQHSMFLNERGEVYVCGSNQKYQLGITEIQSHQFKPVVIQSLLKYKITRIEANQCSAAITDNGELFLWGTGVFGVYKTPQKILTISNQVQSISLGETLGAAIDNKGLLWTWGTNQSGELGVGDNEPRVHPYPVLTLKGKTVTQIACGGSFVVALGNTIKKELPGLKLKKSKDSAKLGNTRKSSGQLRKSLSKGRKKTSSTSNLARKESQSSIGRIYSGSNTHFSPSSRGGQVRQSKNSLHKVSQDSKKRKTSKPKQQQSSQGSTSQNTVNISSIMLNKNISKQDSLVHSPEHQKRGSSQQRQSFDRRVNQLDLTQESLPPQHPVNTSTGVFYHPPSTTNKEKIIRDLQTENKSLKTEHELLKKDYKLVKSQVEQLEKQVEKYKVYQQQNTELQMYMNEVKRKEHEMNVLKLKKDELKRHTKNLQDRLDLAHQEKEVLMQEKEETALQMQQISQEFQTLQQNYSQSQHENSLQQQDLEAFQSDLAFLRDQSKLVEQDLLFKLQEISEKYKQSLLDKEDWQHKYLSAHRKLEELQLSTGDQVFYVKAIEKENAFLREEIERVKFSKDKQEYSRFLSGLVPQRKKEVPESPLKVQEVVQSKTPLQEVCVINSDYKQAPSLNMTQPLKENQPEQRKEEDVNQLKLSYNQKLLKSIEKKTLSSSKFR